MHHQRAGRHITDTYTQTDPDGWILTSFIKDLIRQDGRILRQGPRDRTHKQTYRPGNKDQKATISLEPPSTTNSLIQNQRPAERNELLSFKLKHTKLDPLLALNIDTSLKLDEAFKTTVLIQSMCHAFFSSMGQRSNKDKTSTWYISEVVPRRKTLKTKTT